MRHLRLFGVSGLESFMDLMAIKKLLLYSLLLPMSGLQQILLKGEVMANETKHTPTPWFSKNYGYEKNSVFDENGTEIAFVHYSFNAAHIVKCVNMHDELVEALNKIIDETYDLNANSIAYETLKKAGAL